MGAQVNPKDEMNGWIFAITLLLFGLGLSGLILAIVAGVGFLHA